MSDVLQPQPTPIVNDAPCVQDAVIADIQELGQVHSFCGSVADVAPALLMADIEARKATGLAKYGTLLQPNNGRVAMVDAYQEAIDLVQYLKQDVLEGRASKQAYRFALEVALVLRTELLERERTNQPANA